MYAERRFVHLPGLASRKYGSLGLYRQRISFRHVFYLSLPLQIMTDLAFVSIGPCLFIFSEADLIENVSDSGYISSAIIFS